MKNMHDKKIQVLLMTLKQQLNDNFSERLRALEARHVEELKEENTKFDRFHSPLRYFNSKTHNSNNCYRGLVFGPTLDKLGQWLNFMSDIDCEVLADFWNPKYSTKNKAKALGLLAVSSIGALLRVTANVVDYLLDAITSPVATLKKLYQNLGFTIFKQPGRSMDRMFGNYKVLEPSKPLESSTKSLDLKDAKASKAESVNLRTLSLNCGLLRDLYWDVQDQNLNGLRRPRIRAVELANGILKKVKAAKVEGKPYDVICLQEVFDNMAYFGLGKDAQTILIEKLREEFPYIVYDIGKKSWPAVSSGLMVLSRHPVVDVEFHRYANLAGVDVFSNKGFVAVKVKKGGYFTSIYNTHLQAGATDSGTLRGQEMGLMYEHMRRWQERPALPPYQNLKYLDTVVMGDLNEGLNNPEKMLGESHGKKPSGQRKAGSLKYMGKARLFHEISPVLPDNFVDLRIGTPIEIIGKVTEQLDLSNIKKNDKGEFISADLGFRDSENQNHLKKRPLEQKEIAELNNKLKNKGIFPIVVMEHPKQQVVEINKRRFKGIDRDKDGKILAAEEEKRSFLPPFKKSWMPLSAKTLNSLNEWLAKHPNDKQTFINQVLEAAPDLRIHFREEYEVVVEREAGDPNNRSHYNIIYRKIVNKQNGSVDLIPFTPEEMTDFKNGAFYLRVDKKGFHPTKVQLFEYTLDKLFPANKNAANSEIEIAANKAELAKAKIVLRDNVYLGTAIREDYLRHTNDFDIHPQHQTELTGGKLIDTNLSRKALKQAPIGNGLQCKSYHSKILRFSDSNPEKPEVFPTDHFGIEMEAEFAPIDTADKERPSQ